MALKNNTWKLNQWYDQDVAGNVSYSTTLNEAWAWGENQYGQLAQNDTTHKSSPVQIPGTTWSRVGVRGDQVAGVKTDGTLWTWGRNEYGMLGQNDTTNKSSPVQLPGTTWSSDWGKLSGPAYALMGAIKTDGTLWIWGYNAKGQLGQNNLTTYSSPKQVPGTTWNTYSSNYEGSYAIRTDGTLWSWGRNNNGNYTGILGHNNQTSYSSPKQIPGTWSNNFDIGEYGSMAVNTDGELWGWGAQAERGTLGQNEGGGWDRYSSPVQIPGTTWSQTAGQLDINSEAAIAMKTDGTLWAWGRNEAGRCGPASPGGNDGFSSPVQVPGTTWSQVASGNYNTLAVKTDGTLWVWGSNKFGAHGRNNVSPSDQVFYSPLQIGSDTDWSECDMSRENSATKSALKVDGTLWVWGDNRFGQLGLNTNEDSQRYYSSPTQIPGTWADPINGHSSCGAAQIL